MIIWRMRRLHRYIYLPNPTPPKVRGFFLPPQAQQRFCPSPACCLTIRQRWFFLEGHRGAEELLWGGNGLLLPLRVPLLLLASVGGTAWHLLLGGNHGTQIRSSEFHGRHVHQGNLPHGARHCGTLLGFGHAPRLGEKGNASVLLVESSYRL